MKAKAIVVAFFLIIVSAFSAQAGKVQEPIFFNGLNDHAEISNARGKVNGFADFVPGIVGNGLKLYDDSSISFFVYLSDTGTIDFCIKPEFDVKEMYEGESVGIFETDNFPGPDSFGVWVYKSEWGPVVIFEAKDSKGNFVQAWSKVTKFEFNKWHGITLNWGCNKTKYKKNWGQVTVDGKKGKKKKGFGQYIDLGEQTLVFGDNSFWSYAGKTATFENLKVYDLKVKSSWKKTRKLIE